MPPTPHREADLARPRSRRGGDVKPVTKGVMRKTTIPHADPSWHPIARKLWDSLKTSGQADFFQNSDWAYAYSLMDDLSHYKSSRNRSSMMLQSIMAALSNLMVTEVDRRKVRIELHEPEPERTPASVLAIADYQRELNED